MQTKPLSHPKLDAKYTGIQRPLYLLQLAGYLQTAQTYAQSIPKYGENKEASHTKL